MKLLFDENLSPKLPGLLESLFPMSAHVRDCALLGLTDQEIWDFARREGFIIVSKDSDFQQRSLLYGPPPKVVWLRMGNCTRPEIVELLTRRAREINVFAADASEAILVLS